MSDKRAFILPVSIVSPTDIARLTREIEAIDAFFRQEAIRQAGQQNALPRMSKLMDQLTADNQLNLLQTDHRQYVVDSLEILHESAPVLHMSFSVDPPGPYVQKIVAWLRKNIHPQVLVTVGLQPNIGAGCVVRTTNRLFDFSLREYFNDKREFFIGKLHEAIVGQADVVLGEVQNTVPDSTESETAVSSQPVTNVPESTAVTQQPVVAAEIPVAPVDQAAAVTSDQPVEADQAVAQTAVNPLPAQTEAAAAAVQPQAEQQPTTEQVA